MVYQIPNIGGKEIQSQISRWFSGAKYRGRRKEGETRKVF